MESLEARAWRRQSGTGRWVVTSISLVLSTLLVLFGPAAVDQAAHFHLEAIFARHGFLLWDNLWYLGRYSFVNYSFLFYLLAFVVGLKSLAVFSVTLLVLFIQLISDRFFPWAFSGRYRYSLVVVATMVMTGAWPFLFGAALSAVALWFYGRRRRWPFALFSLLVTLSSPLALASLALAIGCLELPIPGPGETRWPYRALRSLVGSPYLGVVSLMVLLQLLSMRAFPDHGSYPYWWSDLALTEAFVAVCLLLVSREMPHAQKIKLLLAGYGLMNLAAFVVRSDLGSNASRINDFALPVVAGLLSYRRFSSRIPAATLLGLSLAWNMMPLSQVFSAGLYRTSAPSYWERLAPVLRRYVAPGSRVEVVDTLNHEGAYYLPEMGYPLVRGWFRQDDFPENGLLYSNRGLKGSSYRRWLRNSGASVVVLPAGPYDFSSQAEARLLASGRSGLDRVATVSGVEIFRVPGSPALLRSPGGGFLPSKIHTGSVSFQAAVPGTYRLSIFYSPYFVPSQGSLCRESNGMTAWKIYQPGSPRLEFAVKPSTVVSVLLGNDGNSCG